jgi:hypothetical protein
MKIEVISELLSKPKWATARSGLPSRSRSAVMMPHGPTPVLKLCAAWNVPSPLPRITETLFEP